MNTSEKKAAESLGYLSVRAYTAGEALPVVGARVTIRDGGDHLITEEIVKATDRSGETAPIALPAPSSLDSQSPSDTRPYAIYDLTVTHPQFYPFIAKGVPVFAGVTALQGVNMIPLSIYDTAKLNPTREMQNEQVLWNE